MDVCWVNGQYALYINQSMDDIPGLYRYECLEDKETDAYILEIRQTVSDSFAGTILTKKPIDSAYEIAPRHFRGFSGENSSNIFVNLLLSPAEFMAMDDEEIRNQIKLVEKGMRRKERPSRAEMHAYSYHYNGITPISYEEALSLYHKGYIPLLLRNDNTEAYADSEKNIIEHGEAGGMFGME